MRIKSEFIFILITKESKTHARFMMEQSSKQKGHDMLLISKIITITFEK
jgi:hypothetical protein